MIEFNIWERGNIDVPEVEKTLIQNTKYALSDVFLEFHLFCTPICFIPKNLQSSVHSSRRGSIVQRSVQNSVRHHTHSSSSSSVTTPKTIKTLTGSCKFFSEPTTPNDTRSETPTSKVKDDLSLISESPLQKASVEISPEEIEKRRRCMTEMKRESPFAPLKKISR